VLMINSSSKQRHGIGTTATRVARVIANKF
jgi:hypothetical protein